MSETGREPSRRELFDRYERLEAQIDHITKHELPKAHLRGWRHEQKVRDKIDRLDAELSRLHAILYRSLTWEEGAADAARALFCDYCGSEYRFRDRRERYQRGGVCPRCTGEPLGANDPNWNPTLDNRRH